MDDILLDLIKDTGSCETEAVVAVQLHALSVANGLITTNCKSGDKSGLSTTVAQALH